MQLREPGPPPTVLPLGYDVNSWCEFHFGAPGHSIENCKALKYKVQDLIDSKAIMSTPNGPNVNNNPMPPYNKLAVNMVEIDEGRRLVSRVGELKTPLIKIKEQLLKISLFYVYNASCKHYLINSLECEVLKSVIQRLMNEGIMVVEHRSTSEDVSTLEIPYDEVQPLQIPYDLSPMTISDNPVTPLKSYSKIH